MATKQGGAKKIYKLKVGYLRDYQNAIFVTLESVDRRGRQSPQTSDHLGRCEDLVRARVLHNFAACSSTNGESLDSG